LANLETTSDIHSEVLRKCGELTDGTSGYHDEALTLINQVYRQILSASSFWKIDIGKPWPWAKSRNPIVLNLEPKYDTGTVSVINGSTAVTFSGVIATSRANWYLKVDEDPNYYRLETHAGASASAVLDSEYCGDTDAAAGYKLVKLDYDIGSANNKILRTIAPIEVHEGQPIVSGNDGKIHGVDVTTFKKKFPIVRVGQGVPTYFTTLYESDGVLTLRFNKYPQSTLRVEIDYIPVPTALTIPPVREDVSITIATPGVVTQEEHGYLSAQALKLYTNGALPTGFVAGTTYYVEPIDANSYYLHATSGLLSRINTSGTQSGTHQVAAQTPADSTPIIPVEYRDALVYGATFFLMQRKNDSRAQDNFSLCQGALTGLVEGYKIEASNMDPMFGQIYPRQEEVSNRRYILSDTEG
jgi:hypothetical protein